MSSHHSRQFFINLSNQKESAVSRRLSRWQERRASFENRRKLIQEEVGYWVMLQSLTLVAWFTGMAGVAVIGLTRGIA